MKHRQLVAHPAHRCCAAIASLLFASLVQSATLPGSIDATFQANISSTVEGLLPAPDGKIYAKLSWPTYNMTRLQADGSPDPTFMTGLPGGAKIFAPLLGEDP